MVVRVTIMTRDVFQCVTVVGKHLFTRTAATCMQFGSAVHWSKVQLQSEIPKPKPFEIKCFFVQKIKTAEFLKGTSLETIESQTQPDQLYQNPEEE